MRMTKYFIGLIYPKVKKKIIFNVYQGLIIKQCVAAIKVTSELTRVPYSTCQKIIRNKAAPRKKRTFVKFRKLNENLGVEIKQIIYESYKKNIVPTTESLLQTMKERGFDVECSIDTFRGRFQVDLQLVLSW
jgi:hypothetical protein